MDDDLRNTNTPIYSLNKNISRKKLTDLSYRYNRKFTDRAKILFTILMIINAKLKIERCEHQSSYEYINSLIQISRQHA